MKEPEEMVQMFELCLFLFSIIRVKHPDISSQDRVSKDHLVPLLIQLYTTILRLELAIFDRCSKSAFRLRLMFREALDIHEPSISELLGDMDRLNRRFTYFYPFPTDGRNDARKVREDFLGMSRGQR